MYMYTFENERYFYGAYLIARSHWRSLKFTRRAKLRSTAKI